MSRPSRAEAAMGSMCGGCGMTAGGEWVLDHTVYMDLETNPSMPELYTKPWKVQETNVLGTWLVVVSYMAVFSSFIEQIFAASFLYLVTNQQVAMSDIWVMWTFQPTVSINYDQCSKPVMSRG